MDEVHATKHKSIATTNTGHSLPNISHFTSLFFRLLFGNSGLGKTSLRYLVTIMASAVALLTKNS